MPYRIVNICNKIIEFTFYSLFFFVPLILTPWNYELFEYNKMMLVYALTIIIGASWIVKMISLKKLVLKRGPFGLILLLFLASQILSTFFSIDLHTSIWGYYSRFHGGLLSTVAYVVLYFAFISNLSNLSYLGNLVKVILGAGFLVALYGIAEHFGIDRNLWVQDVQNRVFSTLGQPNWLGAYLAVLIPIAIGAGLSSVIPAKAGMIHNNIDSRFCGNDKEEGGDDKHHLKFLFYSLLAVVFYLTLLYTKSRSGLIGFWLADAIFWLIIFIVRAKRELLIPPSGIRRIILSFVVCHLSFVIVTFLVGGSGLGPLEKFTYSKLFFSSKPSLSSTIYHPSSASILETGVTESSDIRKIVWQGARDIFLHNPILGSGVETFAYSYYQYRPVSHNMTSEWDFLYNKAHNEYLNFLATTGLVGFGSWMLFILAFTWWFLKKIFLFSSPVIPAKAGIHANNFILKVPLVDSRMRGNDKMLLVGLFAGWISISITNFFGFSVVIIGLFFFLIPALCFLLTEEVKPFKIETPARFSPAQLIIITLIFLIALISLTQIGRYWYADTFFAKGYRENRSSQYISAYQNLTSAIKINTNEPFYADELSFVSAVLASALDREKDATSASVLSEQAILLSNKVVTENPQNINFLKSRVRIFFALSQLDPAYKKEALAALEKAKALAPTDPKITYNLAVLYSQLGQNDKAEEFFLKTIKLKPDYRDAYYSLALFYQDQKETEKAKEQLNFILKRLNPNDEQAKKKLEEWGE